MTDEHLSFKQETPASEPQNAEAESPEAKSVEEQLKELQAKFSVVQKRVDDSQRYISKLEEEKRMLASEVEKAKKAEEILEAVSSGSERAAEVPKAVKETSSLDPEELLSKAEERVLQKLKAEELKKQQTANFQLVASKLAEAYQGIDIDAKVKEIAAENDMTYEEVVALAKSKPKAALKLLQAEVKLDKPQSSFVGTSMNSVAVAKKGAAKEPEFNSKDPKSVQAWLKWKQSQLGL